jgi:putative metal-binding protein
MRRLLVLVFVLLAVTPAVAWAVELHPVWGDAIIDDNAFYTTGGALLPANQANPRGQIRDHASDGWAVKIRVIAINAAGQNIGEYTVTEGNAVYKTIAHTFSLGQPIAAVLYDFCRADNTCVGRVRINRPASPAPTTQPGQPTPTPAPVDRDGDGFSPPADCDDTNSTVWPGAREIPGNGIDDDCAGGDKPAKILSPVPYDWSGTKTGARLNRLRVTDAPPGSSLELRCSGGKRRGCPFKRHAVTLKADGSASMTKLFKKAFRKGAVLEVWLTAPNSVGKVVRFKVGRGRDHTPRAQTLCLQPGTASPGKC